MRVPSKKLWQRFRGRLKADPRVRSALSAVLLGYLRFVHATNRLVPGSSGESGAVDNWPVILTFWHGRQFVVPLLSPKGKPVSAIVSRSADAELNAAVLERIGMETIRGSGDGATDAAAMRAKNGVAAFRALVRALQSGRTVAMIADRRAAPREAVEGLVRLARISGRPILPVAYETSRSITLEKAWDRAAVNLPFGRAAMITAAPIWVGRNDNLEQKRKEVTRALNAATIEAAGLCAGRVRELDHPNSTQSVAARR